MAKLTFSVKTREVQRKVDKLAKDLSASKVDQVVRRVAYVTHRRLVLRTPKKWTGNTRKSWRVYKKTNSRYVVTNRSKVMNFLEMGTKAHGPVTAKRLFIPKTRKAALAGARVVIGSVIQAKKDGQAPPFKVGVDYILVRKVKGIKARKIVAKHRPFAKTTLLAAMKLHIRKSLNG